MPRRSTDILSTVVVDTVDITDGHRWERYVIAADDWTDWVADARLANWGVMTNSRRDRKPPSEPGSQRRRPSERVTFTELGVEERLEFMQHRAAPTITRRVPHPVTARSDGDRAASEAVGAHQPVFRVTTVADTADAPAHDVRLEADELISLMAVYASQYASYTTLLWQVPALGLTAQSFLLTIALMPNTHSAARIIASIIGAMIALASWSLMHDQRGRAINHAALVRRIASADKLQLSNVFGSSYSDDGKPPYTNAARVWDVDHTIYHVWRSLMTLLAIADLVILIVTVVNPSWAT